MKQNLLCLAATALLLSSCGGIVPEEELVINLQEKGAEVAPSMYGIFFEEINHAGDGGLYAELVKNFPLDYRAGAGLDSEHKGCCGNETDQGTTQILHGSEQSEGNH